MNQKELEQSGDHGRGIDCNGGVGFHQPSHALTIECPQKDKVETEVDKNGHTYVCNDNRKLSGQNCKTSAGVRCKGKMDIKVRRKTICHRKWSVREKYLLIISGLLFLCCIAFVIIAFMRENIKQGTCPCKGK